MSTKVNGIQALTTPIQPDEIEWRVQTVKYSDPAKKNPERLTMVAYINNRCVQNRFDSAFGWDKWSCTFRELNDGFICQIRVETDSGFVIKEDGANKTQVEPVKGGISDSMKRCAVQFGLGRGLYEYPNVYIYNNTKYIPNWAMSQLSDLVREINNGNSNQQVVHIKNTPVAQRQAPQPTTPPAITADDVSEAQGNLIDCTNNEEIRKLWNSYPKHFKDNDGFSKMFKDYANGLEKLNQNHHSQEQS